MQYLPDNSITFRKKSYEIIIDRITPDKTAIGRDEFIFGQIEYLPRRYAFFVTNAKNHQRYYTKNNKLLPIGFWHTIFNNEINLFDFSKDFQYKVETENAVLIIENRDSLVSSDIIYKTTIDQKELANYDILEINADSYKKFAPIRDKKQEIRYKKRQNQKSILRYAIVWSSIVILIVNIYLYFKQDADKQEEINNSLKENENSLIAKIKKLEKDAIKSEEDLSSKHLKNMILFNNDGIGMSGDFPNPTKNKTFVFDTEADPEILRQSAIENNISIKLKYDPIAKKSKVTWRTE